MQEVLDSFSSGARSGVLLEFGNNGGLVGGSQRRGLEDGSQFGILGYQSTQLAKRAGSRFERGCLNGGRVLFRMTQTKSAFASGEESDLLRSVVSLLS